MKAYEVSMILPVEARFQTLGARLDRMKKSSVPEEIKSELFSFGAVLICGNIERCVELLILEKLKHKAHPQVINFIKSYFKRGTNFDCNAIQQLLNRFDSGWGSAFQDYVNKNPDIKEGVSSCYAVRNSVAHGGSGSMGSSRLTDLYEISKRLIEAIAGCLS